MRRKGDEVSTQQIGCDPAFGPAADSLADAAALGVDHFGVGVNDARLRVFREALELGYWVTPAVEISAFVDHVSNGGLAKQNQSINDVGGRVGVRF